MSTGTHRARGCRAMRAALVVVVTVALGACGSSSKKASSADGGGAANPTQPSQTAQGATTMPIPTTTAARKACELAPQDQANAVLGMNLQPGNDVRNADTDSCTYSADPNGPVGQLELFVGDGAKKFYDDDHITLGHTFTDVPGLGDEAHEEDDAIFFRKGSTWVALRVTSLNDWSQFKDRAETLAKNVASQL